MSGVELHSARPSLQFHASQPQADTLIGSTPARAVFCVDQLHGFQSNHSPLRNASLSLPASPGNLTPADTPTSPSGSADGRHDALVQPDDYCCSSPARNITYRNANLVITLTYGPWTDAPFLSFKETVARVGQLRALKKQLEGISGCKTVTVELNKCSERNFFELSAAGKVFLQMRNGQECQKLKQELRQLVGRLSGVNSPSSSPRRAKSGEMQGGVGAAFSTRLRSRLSEQPTSSIPPPGDEGQEQQQLKEKEESAGPGRRADSDSGSVNSDHYDTAGGADREGNNGGARETVGVADGAPEQRSMSFAQSLGQLKGFDRGFMKGLALALNFYSKCYCSGPQ